MTSFSAHPAFMGFRPAKAPLNLGEILITGIEVTVWLVEGRRLLSDEDARRVTTRWDEQEPDSRDLITAWTLI